VWGLPGPGRLVTEIMREVVRGRHVVTVLPSSLMAARPCVDGLVSAVMEGLRAAGEDPCRVPADALAEDPLRALAESLVFVDSVPRLTADLLDHPDAAGRTAVIDCSALGPDRWPELSDLVFRIARESRPRPALRRPRVVVVGDCRVLRDPGWTGDVTVEVLWWWGRLSRWDVASWLAPALSSADDVGVLREVRLETIVEVCRWDLALAERLAHGWDGDPTTLAEMVGATAGEPPTGPVPTCGLGTTRPPRRLLDHWNAGHLDLWHDQCSPSPRTPLAAPGAVPRAVWAAQARVLLPWLETMRLRLYAEVRRVWGDASVQRVVDSLLRGAEPVRTGDPVELGQLFLAVHRLGGRQRPALANAAWWLREARNRLAHLRSLTLHEQRELLGALADAPGTVAHR